MTAQIPDVLILRGKKVEITFCPPLPERHPRIVKVRRVPSKINKPILSAIRRQAGVATRAPGPSEVTVSTWSVSEAA